MIVLHGRTADGISLAEALSGCAGALSAGEGAVALLYSPERCIVASVDGAGGIKDAAGAQINLAPVFEMRAFGPNAELRWLNEVDGLGRAVLLSEQEIASYLADELPYLRAYDTIPQTYLMWGKAADTAPGAGWSRLVEGRIGHLDIPLKVPAAQRARIRALEYLDVVDHHGNVAVVEERLLGLASEEEHG